ncbi:spindle pole body component 110-like [Dendronephthya gigantea]|uniref:spindle pole body component 110-like n=1 Tax=Dendronephthya gigantea TaxID=151771 RepID=UPI00106982F8|nr:spindle pole body component 110-like [Dendronephthya gigantea]
MVLPFEKQPVLHKRYEFYTPSSKVGDPNAEDYVNFLKNMSSNQSPDEKNSGQLETSLRSVKAKVDTGLGGQSSNKIKGDVAPLPKGTGVQAVTQIAATNKKELDRKMKVIQDNLLQRKQEERKLKRIEGDIVKKQRLLRRVMANYDNDVFDKKKVEEMKLQGSIKEMEDAKHQYLVEEFLDSKSKRKKSLSEALDNRQLTRKDLLMKNDLVFQYEKTAKELELKRNEVVNLTKEYEQKVRLKELEEYNLTKRLAELAIATTMEDHKRKTMETNFKTLKKDAKIVEREETLQRRESLEDKLNLGRYHERRFVGSKRRLSQDRDETNDKLSLKIREEGRKMTDISRSLQNNSTAQKNSRIYADYLDRQEQGKNIELKQKMAEGKRTTILEQFSRERKDKNRTRMTRTQDRCVDTETDTRKLSYSDAIRHLQKSVSKQEEMEHALYNQVRSSETNYKKQEQQCQRLQENLTTLKRENAKRLKELELECKSRETSLKQNLAREQATLQKARANREEGIQSLVKLRDLLREDKHRLNEDEREHHRLARLEYSTRQQEIS